MYRTLMAVTLGASLVLAAGCGEEQPAAPAQAPAPQTQGSAPAPAQQEKEQYTRTVQKELDEIKLDIEALKAEASTASVESKDKLKDEVTTLEQKWEYAEKQFDELKGASGEAWREIRPTMDAVVTELRQSLSNAKAPA